MKFKKKEQKGHAVIKARAPFREEIDQEKLEQFAQNIERLAQNNHNIQVFFKPTMIKKRCIKYIGIPGIPLSKYLKHPISKHEFFGIIEQLVIAARSLWENGFTAESVVSDLNHVYINEMTKEIRLIYLPTLQNKMQNNFIELMEAVVYAGTSLEDDKEYLTYFVSFIRGLGFLQKESIEKLENYVAKEQGSARGDSGGTSEKSEGKRGDSLPIYDSGIQPPTYFEKEFDNQPDTEAVNEERYRIPQRGRDAALDYDKLDYSYFRQDALGKNEEKRNVRPKEDGKIGISNEEEIGGSDNTLQDEPEDDNGKTSMLHEDGAGDTDFADQAQKEVPHMPVLFRISTGETITYPAKNKVFRLGKEENAVDYAVTDNNAVSRSHADIIRRGDKYFVFDLGSKNKTYINNRALPSQYEVEINNGDILKLANEEFEFRM